MRSPSKTKSDCVLGLTQNEAKVLLLGILATSDQGKVDYDKIAENGGWKGASAAVIYRNARKKFMELMAGNGGDAGETAGAEATSEPTTPAKKSPTKRMAKVKADRADADANGDEGGEAASASANGTEGASFDSPKKRQRKTPTKKGIAVKANKKKGRANGADNSGDKDEDVAFAIPTNPKSKATPKSKTVAKKDKGFTAVNNDAYDASLFVKADDSAGDMDLPGDSSMEREIDTMDDMEVFMAA